MNLVEMLARYVDTGQAVNTFMRDAEDLIGKYGLRVLCISLLEWMKSQHRIGKLRPLPFKPDHTWCEDLRELMGNSAIFDGILEIRDKSLDFAAVLAEESRKELCAAADRSYNPPLRT